MFPFVRSFQISPWFPNASTLEAEGGEICVQVNSLCPCRMITGPYSRQGQAPWFASCCSYGKFLFQSKQFLFFQVDVIKCRITAGLTGTESHPGSPLCLPCLEILQKIFWHKFIVKHQFWSGNPSFQRSELTSYSSSGLRARESEYCHGTDSKTVFPECTPSTDALRAISSGAVGVLVGLRSGLTASPRQPAHRKASESFSLMREPQMSNTKKS